MPVCCRCNGGGRCKSCICVKSGRPCVDCLPSRKGHCCNNAPSTTTTTASDNGHCLSLSPSVGTSATVSYDNALDTQAVLTSSPEGANDSAIFDDVITGTLTASTRTLPTFNPAPSMTSSWGGLSGEEFTIVIDEAYAEVVHW